MAGKKDEDGGGLPSIHDVFVRGGTTSARHDAYYAQLDHEAEQRRKAEQERAQQAAQAPSEAKQHVTTLGGTQEHAMIVLEMRHPRDKVAMDWMTCELIAVPKASDGTVELVLNMVCPKCIGRGVKMQNAQMKIHQSNRMFHLDDKRRGELWVNPADPREVFTLAGEITMDEWASCSRCSFRFTIEKSVLRWQ